MLESHTCPVPNPAPLARSVSLSLSFLLFLSFSTSHTPLVCREDTFWIMVERKVTLITPNKGKQFCSFLFHKARTSGCESEVCVCERERRQLMFYSLTWFQFCADCNMTQNVNSHTDAKFLCLCVIRLVVTDMCSIWNTCCSTERTWALRTLLETLPCTCVLSITR